MPAFATTEALFAGTSSRVSATSWISRLVMLGATSIIIGILWDISWHRTIGRDTFWTPAHLAIYLGGVLGGATSGWLIVRTTFFGSAEERAAAVTVWGMRGPLGAWVSIWGGLAMLTSAPFDDWWHNAYGLDVKILSPPHTILALGMWAVVLGALLLVLREQNNAGSGCAAPGRWLYVYGSGVLLAMAAVFLIEYSFPNDQRTAAFYRASAATYPLYLIGFSRPAKVRWAATSIAAIYMVILASMVWVLPLFPGQPRLGPIYNHITHFVPMPFPLLLVVPAVAIDLLRQAIGEGRGWRRDWALVISSALAFVALFCVTQWFFSRFMLSPAADNWFFGGNRHWGYVETPGPWRFAYWHETNPARHPPFTGRALATSLLSALVAARVGLWLGNWMAKVRR